jgi:hypothetical protein
MRRHFLPAAALLLLVGPSGGASSAQPQRFEADYSVTLYGLPVAKARFVSSFEGNDFRIDGALSSSGVGRLFDSTRGTTSVSGTIGRDGLVPRSYVVEYSSNRKRHRTAISFSGDRVESAVNEPQPKRGGPDWIAVPQQELRAVLDPITSTLVRADGPERVCNRTVRIFDGEMRADLRLVHVSTGQLDGFAGAAVTCRAEFVPVAGYRKGRRQIEYLANRSRMTVTLAPLGDTGIYSPVEASVGTQVGTVRVRAERIALR